MNCKLNKDLLEETVKFVIEEIQAKETETSYEVGSGSLYISVFGNLFPKLWGQEMKAFQKYYLIATSYRHDVKKELYDSVEQGDLIEFRYSKYSETLLGIQKYETKLNS